MQWNPMTLRRSTKEAEAGFKRQLESLKKNAWKNKYYNEFAALAARHDMGETQPSSCFYGKATGGCDGVMRFIATAENLGWVFDYESFKLSEYDFIEIRITSPVTMGLYFSTYTAKNCRVVQEKTYEYKEVETVTRKIICD